MTKSSNKNILRGAIIKGTTYCGPGGSLEGQASIEAQSEENLKALEEFWYQKGLSEGERKGYDKGLSDGQLKGLEQGKTAGYEEGLKEGKLQGQQDALESHTEQTHNLLEDKLIKLDQLAQELNREKELLFSKIKPELIRFSIAICEKVLQQKLRNPEVLTTVYNRILDQSTGIIDKAPIHIFLPKEHFSQNQELLKELASAKGYTPKQLLFSEDKHLKEGSFRIETDMGLMNFNISRLLEELEASALTENPGVS